MGKKNLVSINDFSRDEILKIMELAAGFEADPHQQVLAGKVIASLFFEPSTRTRLSFESAINHLGGRVIGFSDTSNTSVSKGETFHGHFELLRHDRHAPLYRRSGPLRK